ncbi:MAG TPA: glycosyltransferase family 2 protein [Stenomitos sp.]
MSLPLLSIIVVNWNTREVLRRCLESVQAETLTPFELWVVDNGSTDGSPEMVAADFPDVHLIANHENLGFAAANNQALVQAKGRYHLLLNSDTLVLDHALDRMVGFMENHPEVGAIGSRLLNADYTLQPSAHNFYSTLGSLVENKLVGLFWTQKKANTRFLSYWDHSSTRQVDWVTGACLMVRQEVTETVGLLDESFFMYGEEIDWQMRMAKAGYPVWYLHAAEIIHLGGASSARVPDRMRKQEYRSRQILIDKHYGRVTRTIFRAKTALGIAFWQVLNGLRGRKVSWG